MYKASVPKLAKIVSLLGGFGPLMGGDEQSSEPDGDSYVISLNEGKVILPSPVDDDNDADDDAITSIAFPDIDGPNHTFKALHITLMSKAHDHFLVWVDLAGSINGDPIAERRWMSCVPSNEWQCGEWGVYGTEVQSPYMAGLCVMARESDEKASEIADGATKFDRHNQVVAGCLRLAEKHVAA